MEPCEFLMSKRPVSLQTKRRANLQAWKRFVAAEAMKAWGARAPVATPLPLRCSIVYLCDSAPADIDNIIKPIQDALVGLVIGDDFLISDVDSHRRFLTDPIDVTFLPPLLQAGVAGGNECVYVRVCDALPLRSYL